MSRASVARRWSCSRLWRTCDANGSAGPNGVAELLRAWVGSDGEGTGASVDQMRLPTSKASVVVRSPRRMADARRLRAPAEAGISGTTGTETRAALPMPAVAAAALVLSVCRERALCALDGLLAARFAGLSWASSLIGSNPSGGFGHLTHGSLLKSYYPSDFTGVSARPARSGDSAPCAG